MIDANDVTLIGNQVLPWKRYWVPWDGNIHSGWDGTGFITEPEGSFGKAFNPHLRLIKDIIDRPFLVLSGQPGIGKTQVVKQLKADWGQVAPMEVLVDVEGRTLDNTAAIYRATVDAPLWKTTLASDGRIRLLVDGVDEAIMRQVDLTATLHQALANQPLDRIHVILVCRAAEWDAEEGKRFSLLWKECRKTEKPIIKEEPKTKKDGPDLESATVWELCHLRRADAEIAATACGVDPRAFLKIVAERRIEGLAARPITLRMLLEEFKADPGIKATYHDLYRRSIRRLCGEVNEERRRYTAPYPPREQVYRTASRLAACLLFNRKSIIVKTTATSENTALELDVGEMEGDDVAEDIPFKIDRSLIGFMLDTPLFSFRGPNYGFEQKTYAEFLAADYVARCSVNQLRSLFCATINDREIIPQHLAEVAAKVAARHDDWCRHLCVQDPEVLLRADSSPLSNELKSLIVKSFLRRVANEEAFDHQGLNKFYGTLNHPGIAEELRPYINDPSFNLVVRRIAIDIAGDCELAELEEDLWRRAEADDNCINWIGPALRKITGLHAFDRLMQVLEGKFPPGAFRTLGGVAIEILVPARMPVRDVLRYLQPTPKKGRGDDYNMACNFYLHEHLVVADLAPTLQWLTGIPGVFDSLHSINRFAEHVFELALGHLDDPMIESAVVSLWIECVIKHYPLPKGQDQYDRDPATPHGLAKPENRRALAAALIRAGAIFQQHPYMLFQEILSGDDGQWLLEELDKAHQAHIPAWAKACGIYLRPAVARKSSELVLRLYDQCEELRSALPPLEGGFDYVTSLERFAKRGEEEIERQTQQMRDRRPPPPPNRKTMIEGLLAHPHPKSAQWVRIVEWLWVKEPEDPKTDKRDHGSVISSPGWIEADEATKLRIKACARQFLILNRDGQRKVDYHTNYSIAAYAAIRLFVPELDLDDELARAILTNWSRAIFNALRDDNDDHAKLVQWCYQRRPKIGLSVLLAKMSKNNENGLADYVLEPYLLCWDKRLGRAVCRLMLGGTFTARSNFRMISWLVAHDPASARFVVEQSGLAKRPLSDQAGERALLLAAWLIMPDLYWETFKPILEKAPDEKIKTVFLEATNELIHGDRPVLGALSDGQLADLGKIIFRIFPSARDPDRATGEVHEVTTVDRMVDFRRSILNHLVARGTIAASSALLQIAQHINPNDRLWTKWRHSEAQRSTADKLVPPRTSREITQLVLGSHRALIDSEDDLVTVILESLGRLQAKLRIHSSEWRALWNEDDLRAVKNRRHASGLEPKAEAALSDVVAQWLRQDWGPANRLVLNREVEVSKHNVTDIKVDAVAKNSERPLTVIIENKRCINRDIKTSLKTQLVDRYLVPHDLTHGIYLIGWYCGPWQPPKPPAWKAPSIHQAREEAHGWAAAASTNEVKVISYLLDCTGGTIKK